MSNNAFGKATNVDPDLPLSPEGVTYHLTATSKDLADRIILVGDPGRVKTVAEYFDKGSVCYEASHREINIATGTYKGVPVSCVSTGMGTDNVEIVVNEVHILKEYDVAAGKWRVRAGDAEAASTPADHIFTPSNVRMIRVGTCGSPNSHVKVGDLAITRHGVGMDNTCQYYIRQTDADMQEVLDKVKTTCLGKVDIYATEAAPEVTHGLVAACDAINAGKPEAEKQSYVVGTTFSGSGFYGCQGRCVGRFKGHLTVPTLVDELGHLRFNVTGGEEMPVNIEMENSALCCLSRILGYQAGTICVVIASRSPDGARAFATPDQSAKGLANAITVALDAVVA